jgi:5-methylcytosine-specific restriction endonuclease McrA
MGATYVRIPTSIWSDPAFTSLPWWEQHAWFVERIKNNGRGRRTIPPKLRAAVYERDGHACLHCGTNSDLSLDHVHPYSLGGEDTMENLQTLCRPCNSRKGAKP